MARQCLVYRRKRNWSPSATGRWMSLGREAHSVVFWNLRRVHGGKRSAKRATND